MKRLRVLVLNADYRPIGEINWQRGMVLDLKGECQVVEYYDEEVKDTKGYRYKIPCVIRRAEYVKLKPYRIKLNKKNLFQRDHYTCQYCHQVFHAEGLTFDHIIPRSKWNQPGNVHSWENVVACCFRCNNKKGDRTPEQAGMKLLKKPIKPDMSKMASYNVPEKWKIYIQAV